MRAKQGNVYGLLGTGSYYSELLKLSGREQLSASPTLVLRLQEEKRHIYAHKNVQDEVTYLKEYLISL